MKKILVLVIALTNNGKKDHMMRLVENYNVITISPDSLNSPWVLEMVGKQNNISVPYPYNESSIEEGVSKLKHWEGKHGQVNGVMTLCDECIEYTAALIESLNITRSSSPLQGMSHLTATLIKNKYEFRKMMQPFSKPIRSFCLKSLEDVAMVKPTILFPAILKPLKGAGSMYVRQVDNFDSLCESFSQFQTVFETETDALFPEDWKEAGFVLEEIFKGDEVDIDGWACNGRVQFAVVKDEIPTGPPDFCERGGYYPSQLSTEKKDALLKLTNNVVETLRDFHGAFHFEAMINEDLEVFVVEMNARAGSAETVYAVEATTGYHLPTAHAQVAVGDHVCKHSEVRYNAVVSKNLYLDREVELLGSHAIPDEDMKDVIVFKIYDEPRHYIPHRGSASCLCIFAVGGDDFKHAKTKADFVEGLVEFKWS